MSRLIRFCAVAAFFSGASAQPPKLDIIKYLKDISSQAEKATEYAFEGKLEVAAQSGTAPGKLLARAKVRFASGPEGKYLLEIDSETKGQYTLASDGQKSWSYVPKLKQYSEDETGAVDSDDAPEEAIGDSERDLAELYSRQVVHILSGLYRSAAEAGPGGEADIAVGKKKVKGPVIRVSSKRDAKGGSTYAELVLEPDSLKLARLVFAHIFFENDAKVITRLTMDFSSFQLGESIPDSTFTFVPPKNSKQVDSVAVPGQTGSFLVNRAAPEFDLKSTAGERMHLADFRGHPVLLDFWASWCGPCRKELPTIARLAEEYRAKGLVVLGVNDEGKGTARSFASKNSLDFAILDDSEKKMARSYHVRAIPSVFYIDPDGKVVHFFLGAHSYESLKAALKDIGL